jgi:carboxymethylenebutenolidase
MAQKPFLKEKTELKVANAPAMLAYVAQPEGDGPHPGLILFQEAFGVNAHIRDVTERFAREGYVAIAPELFHRTAPPGFEPTYGDRDAIAPHFQAITIDGLEADIRATHDWLRSNAQVKADEISCVGFCMGGRATFLANSIVPLRKAVSFYGGGIAQGLLDRAAKQFAPLLLFWGGLDQHITLEHRHTVADALTAARKDFINVEFSRADHGFFCDARSAYNPTAARQAWALMLEFLRS